MSFWTDVSLAMCRHGAWLDDGPDTFGQRLCAKCECRVTVCLTENLLKTTFNQMSSQAGFPPAFPEID